MRIRERSHPDVTPFLLLIYLQSMLHQGLQLKFFRLSLCICKTQEEKRQNLGKFDPF